jgi:hypothetical protein
LRYFTAFANSLGCLFNRVRVSSRDRHCLRVVNADQTDLSRRGLRGRDGSEIAGQTENDDGDCGNENGFHFLSDFHFTSPWIDCLPCLAWWYFSQTLPTPQSECDEPHFLEIERAKCLHELKSQPHHCKVPDESCFASAIPKQEIYSPVFVFFTGHPTLYLYTKLEKY